MVVAMYVRTYVRTYSAAYVVTRVYCSILQTKKGIDIAFYSLIFAIKILCEHSTLNCVSTLMEIIRKSRKEYFQS